MGSGTVPVKRPGGVIPWGGHMSSNSVNEFKVKGEELLKKVRDTVHEGNVRRIVIKDDKGNPYLELPLTLGVVGVFLAPVWAAIGALAAMASNFTVEIIRRDQEEKK
jgi:hypothetical protein